MQKMLAVAVMVLATAVGVFSQTHTGGGGGSGSGQVPTVTVATLPGSPTTNQQVIVSDTDGSACTSGGGTTRLLCQWSGLAWVIVSGGSGSSPALNSVLDPSADKTFGMGAHILKYSYTASYGSNPAFAIATSNSNVATGPALDVQTGTSTTHDVADFCGNGSTDCIKISSAGAMAATGAASIAANTAVNTPLSGITAPTGDTSLTMAGHSLTFDFTGAYTNFGLAVATSASNASTDPMSVFSTGASTTMDVVHFCGQGTSNCVTVDKNGALGTTGGGSIPGSLLNTVGNPSADKAFDLGAHHLNFNLTGTYGTYGVSFTTNGSNASTDPAVLISTGASTSMDPFKFCTNGTTDCLEMTSAGAVQPLGAVTIQANKITGTAGYIYVAGSTNTPVTSPVSISTTSVTGTDRCAAAKTVWGASHVNNVWSPLIDMRGELSNASGGAITCTSNMFPVGSPYGGSDTEIASTWLLPAGGILTTIGQNVAANNSNIEGQGQGSVSGAYIGGTNFILNNHAGAFDLWSAGTGTAYNPYMLAIGVTSGNLPAHHAAGTGPYNSYTGRYSINALGQPGVGGISIFTSQDNNQNERIGISNAKTVGVDIGGTVGLTADLEALNHMFVVHNCSNGSGATNCPSTINGHANPTGGGLEDNLSSITIDSWSIASGVATITLNSTSLNATTVVPGLGHTVILAGTGNSFLDNYPHTVCGVWDGTGTQEVNDVRCIGSTVTGSNQFVVMVNTTTASGTGGTANFYTTGVHVNGALGRKLNDMSISSNQTAYASGYMPYCQLSLSGSSIQVLGGHEEVANTGVCIGLDQNTSDLILENMSPSSMLTTGVHIYKQWTVKNINIQGLASPAISVTNLLVDDVNGCTITTANNPTISYRLDGAGAAWTNANPADLVGGGSTCNITDEYNGVRETIVNGVVTSSSTSSSGAIAAKTANISGNITQNGSSSGTITQHAQSAAGSWEWDWPISAGTVGQVLTSQGGAGTAMTWTSPITGSGTANQIALFSGTSTLTGLTGTITNSLVTAVNGGAPVFAVPGLSGRTYSTASDTVLADTASTTRDRATVIQSTGAGTGNVVTENLPTGGSSGAASHFVSSIWNFGGSNASTVVRLTPATGTVNGGATYDIADGDWCTLNDYNDGTDWWARCASAPLKAGSNVTLARDGQFVTISSSAGSFGGTLTKTADFTLTASESGKLVIFNCSSACAATLYGTPSSTYTVGIVSIGSTTATVSLNSLTLNGSSSVPVLVKGKVLQLSSDGANYFGNVAGIGSAPITVTGGTNNVTIACATCVTASSPGAGVAHFAGSTQAVTSSAVVGGDMANNTVTATQLAAQYSKGSCTEVWGGSGALFAMQSGDDAIANNGCYNDSGVTRTITAVKCRGDNASNTTTVNPTFGAAGTGTTILSGALTCGNSYAYSASGTVSNGSWTTGTGIDPGMATVGNATSIAMIVEYTY